MNKNKVIDFIYKNDFKSAFEEIDQFNINNKDGIDITIIKSKVNLLLNDDLVKDQFFYSEINKVKSELIGVITRENKEIKARITAVK